MALILASGSPRRKQILSSFGVKFTVRVTGVDETVPPSLSPAEAVSCISMRKAKAVAAKCGDVVLAADTMVAIGGTVFGKPGDAGEAFEMLRALSGNVHSVFTGVAIVKGERTDSFVSETRVEFYPLTEREIREYIATGEPLDKAGAYGIQGLGALLVKCINGDYLNVVGLPAAETIRRIRAFGY